MLNMVEDQEYCVFTINMSNGGMHLEQKIIWFSLTLTMNKIIKEYVKQEVDKYQTSSSK